MKKKDLKAGMLLEIEENGKIELCLVGYNDDGTLNWSGNSIWGDFDVLHEDLTYGYPGLGRRRVLKVYDRIHGNRGAHLLSTDRRKLLWERKHTPEVGDIYKGASGFAFVITKLDGIAYTRLFNDGSSGKRTIRDLDDHIFTGRNIKEELQDLFDKIKV